VADVYDPDRVEGRPRSDFAAFYLKARFSADVQVVAALTEYDSAAKGLSW